VPNSSPTNRSPGDRTGGLRGRALLLAALIACTFLTALDVLVVATAMPTIVAQLGGMSLYAWVFSAFLLAGTVTVPVFGKLSDIYGRKPIFTLGTVIFLVGSALCGMAQDMTQLIIFRAIQGLGAGAVFPITLTIVGDVFSLEERAKIVGLFSAAWGVAGISGPLIGGFLTDNFSWRWIFLLNLPVGVVALAMLWWTFKERVQRREHTIDYLGALLLMASLTALMVGLLDLGSTLPNVTGQTVAFFVAALLLLALFRWHERRAPEPILPLELLGRRLILVAGINAFGSGFINSGVVTFVPVFVQGVLGGTATLAGAVLMPTAITWPTGSVLAGRLVLRLSYRPTTVLGTLVICGGAAILTTLDETSPLWVLLAAVGLVGLGMGLSMAMLTVAVQNSVPWEQRGVATSSNHFFRSIGQAIGVTVFGAVFNLRMSGQLGAAGQDLSITNLVLDPIARAAIDSGVLESIRGILDSSIHTVFLLLLIATVANVFVASRLPGGTAKELEWKPDQPAGAAASSPERAPARPSP
jgi:EmrB/QacA subfamily drug resistance transporter